MCCPRGLGLPVDEFAAVCATVRGARSSPEEAEVGASGHPPLAMGHLLRGTETRNENDGDRGVANDTRQQKRNGDFSTDP
jgi:hypothetical protein